MTTEPLNLGPLTADALLADPRLTDELAPATHPLALLPVRLETRYSPTADGGTELLVRVYPDQVHVDAHDPRLSASEHEAGREFWRAQWRTGSNRDRQQRAWKALAERFGPGRAGWVARATRPTNPSDRPEAEVGDGETLRAEPDFPDVQIAQIRRTPVARLLPDRWTATAYAGGAVLAVATGEPITTEPAVGPDLNLPLAQAEDDAVAAIDEGMNWLVDFRTSEAMGMALRLPLSGPVDLLLVTGIRAGDDASGARDLGGLLEAQSYTEGLAFLVPETTTNNAEQRRSGWSSEAVGDWAPGGRPAVPGTFGAVTAATLGLGDDELFGSLPNAETEHDDLTEAMVTALWPATWGYWLSQFAGVDADTDAWALAHARRFVRPGGALPTLRVGREPYGLLPVTSLSRFTGDDRQNRLRRILVGLVDTAWRPALGAAPRVTGRNVAGELVDVLRLEGRSQALRLRRSVGARFADNAARFLGHNLAGSGFWNAARDRSLPVAAAAGLGLLAGALTVHQPDARPVTLPLVAPNGDLGFLTSLLSADPDALARDADAAQPSVLAALVRHGLLRSHAVASARLLGAPARDAELYGFGEADLGWTAQRDQPLADGGTVRQRLSSQPTGELAEYRRALETLAGAAVPELERQLLGWLDATSHRLDAWVSSLAAARLAELREGSGGGLLVGGFGWVENLRPGTAPTVAQLPPDEDGPLLTLPDDPGFIHTPSINQAQVAALLRNAHLTHGGGEKDPFAVSLTSERVRLARWIFDGVRAGRTVGAVLGYLVERDLHERDLDFAINDAREVAPLPGQEELPPAARRLDGLRLHELWVGGEDHAVDHLVAMTRTPTDDERNRAIAVLRALNAAVDAAADALQAEQVHQFARGDLSRAVSTVGDLDRGLAPPPDLDFLQTPRTGAGVTHRVAILLDPEASAGAGWGGVDDSLRAAAEPALDAWLARMLGLATARTLTVSVAGSPQPVRFGDLRVAASDFVRIAAAGDAGLAELAARAAAAAGGQTEGSAVIVDRELGDLLELARSLSALANGCKPLDGSALQPPHADPAPGVDLAELQARADRARSAVEGVLAELTEALAGPADVERLRRAVAAGWSLGLGEAGFPTSDSVQAWEPAAARVRAALQARLDEADSVATGPDAAAAAQARLRALLGPGFVALPRFVPATAAELAASAADPALPGEDPLAAEIWFTRLERVREPLRLAGIALREAEALGGPAMRLTVAQLPHHAADTWNALPASSYVDGAVSLVLVGGELARPGRTLVGLVVDEWSEMVPSATQTTGIAFSYDPPEAMAPHAILLAVPPVIGEPWTAGSLNQVLVETLELAHLRAVPPSALGAIRQYLPASVLAFNAEGDAVSTNPSVLTPVVGG